VATTPVPATSWRCGAHRRPTANSGHTGASERVHGIRETMANTVGQHTRVERGRGRWRGGARARRPGNGGAAGSARLSLTRGEEGALRRVRRRGGDGGARGASNRSEEARRRRNAVAGMAAAVASGGRTHGWLSAFSKGASGCASEEWGGSRGACVLPWSQARGGNGRPRRERRRRMAATGRAASVATGATRAGRRGGALLGRGAGRAKRSASACALSWAALAAGPKVRRRPAKMRKAFSFQISIFRNSKLV
jgi:hypothetical protein